MDKHIIAIDAMGGDNAPTEIIQGALEALKILPVNILLIGSEELISNELKNHVYDKNRLEIVNATEKIENTDTPTVAIKQKKDSSLAIGFSVLKEKRAHALISAGNTGALLAGATLKVGRIKGIKRPALTALLPSKKGYVMLLDCGANADCKPEYLVQFAKMGQVYMENVMGIKRPKIALANIGVEEQKGNMLTKETYKLLKDDIDINFVGNIEARDILAGDVDVIVADGFVGNIILKTVEGVATNLLSTIKEEIKSTTLSKLGALFAKGAFKNVKKRFDHQEVGGAPFLGLKALVIKAHGSATAKDIVSSAKVCYKFLEVDMIEKFEKEITNNGI